MNLYLLERDNTAGYDTYDSFVVIAENMEKVHELTPSYTDWYSSWVPPEKVTITLLGKSISDIPSILCSSYNTG